MKTINWTTGDGRNVTLTLTVQFELDRQGRRKASGRKEVVTVATLDGEEIYGSVMQTKHPVVVAKIGVIGISQANYDRYLAAYAEVEASFAAHNAALDSYAADLDAVTAASQRIYNTP